MSNMTGDQFGGLLRTVLAFLAGFIPSTFMDGATTSTVVGAVVALSVAMWSWYTNRSSAIVAPTTMTGAPVVK